MKKLLLITTVITALLVFNACEEDVPNPNPNPNTVITTGTNCYLDDCNEGTFTITWSGTNFWDEENGTWYNADGTNTYCARNWNPDCDTALMWDLTEMGNQTEAELTYNMDGTKDVKLQFCDNHFSNSGENFGLILHLKDIGNMNTGQAYNESDSNWDDDVWYTMPEGACRDWDVEPFGDANMDWTLTFTTIDMVNNIFEGTYFNTFTGCDTDSDGTYTMELDFYFDID
jgi:hypothetical protein